MRKLSDLDRGLRQRPHQRIGFPYGGHVIRAIGAMLLTLSVPLTALAAQVPVRRSDSTSTDSVRAALIAPPLPTLAPDSQHAAVAGGPIHVSRFVEVGAVAGLAAGLVEGIALVHSCDGCTTYGLYTKAWIPLAAFGGALDGTVVSTVAYGGYRLVRYVRRRHSA